MNRYLVISSDTHAGPPSEAYRDYVDPQREACDDGSRHELALRSLILEAASEERGTVERIGPTHKEVHGTFVVVDEAFVEEARRGRSPERRFRFAGACVEEACAQWEDGRCGVIDLVLDAQPAPLQVGGLRLPRCAVRDDVPLVLAAGAGRLRGLPARRHRCAGRGRRRARLLRQSLAAGSTPLTRGRDAGTSLLPPPPQRRIPTERNTTWLGPPVHDACLPRSPPRSRWRSARPASQAPPPAAPARARPQPPRRPPPRAPSTRPA